MQVKFVLFYHSYDNIIKGQRN